MNGRIYFFYIAGFDQIVGGLKQTRLMGKLMNELGMGSFFLSDGPILDQHLYDAEIPKAPFSFDEASSVLGPEDILIVPECSVKVFSRLKNFRCRKGIYIQAGFFALAAAPPEGYPSLGIDFVMTCAPYSASLTWEVLKFPRERIFIIPCWVVREPFTEVGAQNVRRTLGIGYMPRKLPFTIARIKKELIKFEPDVPWIRIDQMSEKEVACRLHSCSLFFSSQDREGFGLPALEAMACGCLVTGYAGTGDFPSPYATRENGLWAPDRSIGPAVKQVLRAIQIARQGGEELDRFLAAGRQTAQGYTKDIVLKALKEMLKAVEKEEYASFDPRIEPLNKKSRTFSRQLLRKYGKLPTARSILIGQIKKCLPSPVVDWLRKAKARAFDFLFHLVKVVKPLKRWAFEVYCRQWEITRTEGRLPSLLRKTMWRFHELGYLPYRVNGISMELDPLSLLDQKLISGCGHDPIVLGVIQHCLNQGGTFLDVGAHIGYFSLLAAKRPHTRVISFEPSPRELARFYRNVELNDARNITIFPCGLADREGMMPLYLDPHGSNSVVANGRTGESVECFFAPLDYFVPSSRFPTVRLVKLDVEGFEMSILESMAESIKAMPQAVFVVEVIEDLLTKAGRRAGEIYAFFESFGYHPLFGPEKLREFVDTNDYNEVFSKNPEELTFLLPKELRDRVEERHFANV